MTQEKFTCPACGSLHVWPLPIPSVFKCCSCKTEFSAIEELCRYTITIYRPGQPDDRLESFYSGRPFIVPRRGDRILSEQMPLSNGESLRVSDIEFGFEKIKYATRQVISVYTELSHDPA